jgi:hypothetical protein
MNTCAVCFIEILLDNECAIYYSTEVITIFDLFAYSITTFAS